MMSGREKGGRESKGREDKREKQGLPYSLASLIIVISKRKTIRSVCLAADVASTCELLSLSLALPPVFMSEQTDELTL